jgi:hypothetical protein
MEAAAAGIVGGVWVCAGEGEVLAAGFCGGVWQGHGGGAWPKMAAWAQTMGMAT